MKKKILAIDDSKAIRFLLQTVLGKDNHVVTAPDGCTAMYWLSQRNRPDLIIVDAQLPDMNNWEFIEQLRSSLLYREIPIFVLSSLDYQETMDKCDELGVAQFFVKPFNPVVLVDSVKQLHSSKINQAVLATDQ